MRHVPVVLLALLPSLLLPAQDPARLDAQRVVGAEFSPQRFGPARWLDGSHYATLEPAGGGVRALELRRVDARSGASSVLVPAARLVPAGSDRPLWVEDHVFSPDGTRVLLFTDSKRVWRQNTRGDYHVLALAGSEPPRRLGTGLPGSGLMFAKWSPDGTRVAYVCSNDLYVEDVASGARTRLTQDGSATLVNGTFDWVYEEEFDCRDGFRWSPDGTRIAYWQLDVSGVGEFLMIDNLSGPYSRTVPVQYPKAGTTNSSARIGVVAATGGSTTWLQTPGDPRENYLARMEWHPGGRELAVQWLPREQNVLRVYAADATAGTLRLVREERDAAYVDVRDDFRWLQGGKSFFWTSDSDGWRHAWTVPWDGSAARLLTPGDADVMAVVHADVDRGQLYVAGCDGNATQQYLFSVDLASGAWERLSPATEPGWHEHQVSPDGSLSIRTFSRFDQPPVVDLVALPSHETLRVLEPNERLRNRVAALQRGKNEFFRVRTADGVEIDGWAMYPHDFDPARRWPVLFHVYGEPWSQTVMDRWGLGHHLFHRWLTQRGYVVMSLDARGTPAPKGRAWRKALYQQIGVLSSHDWNQAVLALQQQHAWVDAPRCAVWGWSGGGAMTLNLLLRHPKLFAAGMSVAPVTDIRLYDTIYQERYCGDPRKVPEVYVQCSPVTHAANLEGALLLVHGTGDDNVHYQNAERMVDALVAHGKKFEFLAYPNRAHGISEGRGTRAHLYDSLADFLVRRVPAGPR
jgi:dipeptidyl-peptidase-4